MRLLDSLFDFERIREETILFWHRGLSLSDIALGHAILAKGASEGVGQRLRYA